jgi:hypothetical protein
VFNLPAERRNALKKDAANRVREKNADRAQLDATEVTGKVPELALSENVYDKAILILLCVGSRPRGVFESNTFKTIPTKPSYIEISGVAKARNDKKDAKFQRPVLFISPSTLIRKWNELREHFKTLKVIDKKGQLATTINTTLNKRLEAVFPWIKRFEKRDATGGLKGQKSSLLRKIYVDMAYKRFANAKSINYNTFVSKTLSHDDDLTSFSYSWLSVNDPDKSIDQVTARLAELEVKTDIIEQKVDDLEEQKEQEEAPEDPVAPVAVRRLSREQKIAKMTELYTANPKISNAKMRKSAGIGSKLVNEFLAEKRPK